MHPLFHPLLHAAHLVESRLREGLAGLGLQPRQARILAAIAERGLVSQAALARAFGVAPPSMTVMIARLERDGLVRRVTAAGQVRPRLALTEAGAARLPTIAAAWTDIDRELVDALGADRALALSRLALDLRDALGGKAPHDHPVDEMEP